MLTCDIILGQDFCARRLHSIELRQMDVFFGVENKIVCFLIFTAKMYIYRKRISEDNLNFEGFIMYLHHLKCVEFEIAKENNKTDDCVEKWTFLE